MKNDYRCKIFKGMFRVLFNRLKNADAEEMEILNRWANV